MSWKGGLDLLADPKILIEIISKNSIHIKVIIDPLNVAGMLSEGQTSSAIAKNINILLSMQQLN